MSDFNSPPPTEYHILPELGINIQDPNCSLANKLGTTIPNAGESIQFDITDIYKTESSEVKLHITGDLLGVDNGGCVLNYSLSVVETNHLGQINQLEGPLINLIRQDTNTVPFPSVFSDSMMQTPVTGNTGQNSDNPQLQTDMGGLGVFDPIFQQAALPETNKLLGLVGLDFSVLEQPVNNFLLTNSIGVEFKAKDITDELFKQFMSVENNVGVHTAILQGQELNGTTFGAIELHNKEKAGVESKILKDVFSIETLEFILDIATFVPGIGVLVGGAKALFSLSRGDVNGVVINSIAMMPFGNLLKLTRMAKVTKQAQLLSHKEALKKLAYQTNEKIINRKQLAQVLEKEGIRPESIKAVQKWHRELFAASKKPEVLNGDLKRIVDRLYRPNAKIGNGSTAAAVRYEQMTGKKVGGKLHTQKVKDEMKALYNWLKRNKDVENVEIGKDKRVAEQLLKDALDSLNLIKSLSPTSASGTGSISGIERVNNMLLIDKLKSAFSKDGQEIGGVNQVEPKENSCADSVFNEIMAKFSKNKF